MKEFDLNDEEVWDQIQRNIDRGLMSMILMEDVVNRDAVTKVGHPMYLRKALIAMIILDSSTVMVYQCPT